MVLLLATLTDCYSNMPIEHYPRLTILDVLKVTACLIIVVHHVVVYGALSKVAYPLAPTLIDWFREYGRISVQVFFVVSGYLFATKFSSQQYGQFQITAPLEIIRHRYQRLITPYLAALILAILCASFARILLKENFIPNEPSLFQLLAHIFLLQDLLDQEVLSAGVWYVAIDFQLFSFSIALLWLANQINIRYPKIPMRGEWLVIGFAVMALFFFNRNSDWDETVFYFYGSYGMGIMIYWACSNRHSMQWVILLLLLLLATLFIDFRIRIAIAGISMLAIALTHYSNKLRYLTIPKIFTKLAQASYSIFLVHFSVIMIMNTIFQFLPVQPEIYFFGLFLTVAASITVGILFFTWFESRLVGNQTRILLVMGLIGFGLIVD
ncbi:MAG: acyltransferase family protein [Nitrosomonas sp.]